MTTSEKIKKMPVQEYRTLRRVLHDDYKLGRPTFLRWEHGTAEPNPLQQKIINDIISLNFGYNFFED